MKIMEDGGEYRFLSFLSSTCFSERTINRRKKTTRWQTSSDEWVRVNNFWMDTVKVLRYTTDICMYDYSSKPCESSFNGIYLNKIDVLWANGRKSSIHQNMYAGCLGYVKSVADQFTWNNWKINTKNRMNYTHLLGQEYKKITTAG